MASEKLIIITFIYLRIFRVAYAANISKHLTIISEIDHDTGNIVPYSFRQVRGFFNIPCQPCNTEDAGDGNIGAYGL